jgi:flagellar protein FliL
MMLGYPGDVRAARAGGAMAKKPRKQEEADEDQPVVEAPSKKKKLMIIGGAGALALLLAGGGAYFFLGSSGEDADVAAQQAPRSVAFVDVREMVINLAPEPNEDRARFLKFRVALEVSDPAAVGAIEPLMPRVEDTFQVFVRELRASELEGSAGVYRLREELLRRVNIAVHPARIDAVLFKEVVVQ